MATAERHRQVRELYAAGLTARQISEAMGLAMGTVYKVIWRRKPEVGGLNVRHRKIYGMYRRGYTGAAIASRLGVSESQVWRAVRKWKEIEGGKHE